MTRFALARTCAIVCAASLLHTSVAFASHGAAPEASEAEPAEDVPSEDAAESAEPEPEPAEEEARAPSNPSEQEANILFREGSMFYELGQYQEAIEKFEAAWKLAPVPQLLYNMGQAHRRWFEVDPEIDHLRQAKTFFVNYDKRMKTDSTYGGREAEYVENMIEKLDAQIQLEEAKEAERNRVIVNGPSAAEIEALEKRRLKREQQLAASKRLNGAGIGLIVVGSVAAAVGLGGILSRTAYKVVLDNSATGDPNTPSLQTAEEDRRRRDGFLLSGQIGFGGLIAAAIFLPVGIGLRVGGGVLERRALGGAGKDVTSDDDAKAAPDGERSPPPAPKKKVAIQPTASGLALHF